MSMVLNFIISIQIPLLGSYLFRVMAQPTYENPEVVGGGGIQLKQKLGDKYIEYEFPNNLLGWKDMWFYIGNHGPALPEKTRYAPTPCAEWNQTLSASAMEQVNELLEIIKELKRMGVTGASVIYSFA